MARSSLSDPRPIQVSFLHFLSSRQSRETRKKVETQTREHRSPAVESPGPGSRLLAYALALIAAAALVVVVIVLAIGAGSDDVDPAHKILELTAQDIDPETTAAEKNLLKAGSDRFSSRRRAVERCSPAIERHLASRKLQRALAEGHVSPAMEPLVKQLAADFGTGKAAALPSGWPRMNRNRATPSIFSSMAFLLADSRLNRTVTRLPSSERTGQSLRLEITGASEANRGAVFRAETATSQAETRHLHAGKKRSLATGGEISRIQELQNNDFPVPRIVNSCFIWSPVILASEYHPHSDPNSCLTLSSESEVLPT